MKYEQDKKTFFVSVEKDEPVMETLTQLCRDKHIRNGQISGIGAVKNIELGAYDLPTQKYTRKTFPETHELISFQGNIAQKDDDPFIHAHISIGNHEFEVHGGHVFEMKVAVVGEFIIRAFDTHSYRELDPNIGLATLCFLCEE